MRCLIAEDHPLFRDAIKGLLQKAFPEIEISEAHCLKSLQSVVDNSNHFDFVLLDLNIPGVYGFSGLLFLQGQLEDTPIIVISANESPDIISKAYNYGADAFIPKSSSTEIIINTITKAMNGEKIEQPFVDGIESQEEIETYKNIKKLSPRQFEILLMLTGGLLNKQIAAELDLSLSTVKCHISAIIKTLQVNTRTHAALIAKKLDISDKVELSG